MDFMQISIGTDIVTIRRFNDIVNNEEYSFLQKNYSDNELDYCFSKENACSHLAGRFAGKEAVIKALYAYGLKPVAYKKIEILNDENGVPKVWIKVKSYEKLKTEISISHCEDKAIAFAIIYGVLEK
ncbi:holo-ACP synthase [Methanogenium organophilum]|uniref:Holo-ACP synthase n=1 Tax=Methanogenium organophilum TaxID=2199 RepID=A0A9X9T7Z6_METOG|nr:holo-ACP synthase [Methanogenium organophilum]WAI01210.1 holo-ACP synthase [Methanogenium organophilum]